MKQQPPAGIPLPFVVHDAQPALEEPAFGHAGVPPDKHLNATVGVKVRLPDGPKRLKGQPGFVQDDAGVAVLALPVLAPKPLDRVDGTAKPHGIAGAEDVAGFQLNAHFHRSLKFV